VHPACFTELTSHNYIQHMCTVFHVSGFVDLWRHYYVRIIKCMDLYIDYCLKHQVCKVHLQTLEVNKTSGLQSRPSPPKVLLDITMCQGAKKLHCWRENIFSTTQAIQKKVESSYNTLVIFCNFGTLKTLYNEMDHEVWCSCLHFKQVCFWSITTCTKIKLQRYNKMNGKHQCHFEEVR